MYASWFDTKKAQQIPDTLKAWRAQGGPRAQLAALFEPEVETAAGAPFGPKRFFGSTGPKATALALSLGLAE